MNKPAIRIITAIVLILLLSACGSTIQEVRKPPQLVKPQEIVLAKVINKGATASPQTPIIQFTTEDSEVIAFLKFENISGNHRLRWEWYGPDKKIFYSTGDYPITVSEGKFQKESALWHRLPIQSEKSVGAWQVKVWFDGGLLASKDFSIASTEIDVDKLSTAAANPNPLNWGLIIGIENYANLPGVDFVKRDADAIKNYFTRLLGIPEENIIFLQDGKATKSTIEGYLKNYLPKNLDKDATLYVYFAGHGAPDIEKGDAYLVPYDGDPRFIAQTAYQLKNFYDDLDKLNIRRSFVFLDACFSGTAARSDKMLVAGIRPALIHVEDVALTTDKIISLSATKGGQVSSAFPEKRHGLFTYYLLSGFRGPVDADKDGWITTGELFKYVKANVERISRRKGMEQIPSLTPAPDVIQEVETIKVGRVGK